jgi:RNA polymerase sigma factor (TIGR02999 family)
VNQAIAVTEPLHICNTRSAEAKRHRRFFIVYTRCRRDRRGATLTDVKALIQVVDSGDAEALQALFGRVYAELKQLAHRQLTAAAGHTLNTTGLVHEAYLKLAQPGERDLQGRAHFFALAAKAMRQIVIDHARARLTEKRGGAGRQMVTLDAAADIADPEFGPDALLRLDRVLTDLAHDEPRLAELVEQRFFAGLSVSDIALMQSVSERTLNRDWRRAKAHLHAALYPDT